MAVSASEVDSVLRFLRINGLAESESALMEEMKESFGEADLGCSDYEKFVFPMVPPLPPLKIPAIPRQPEASSASSSEDEFVSLGSSSSDICSSDFMNPYGNKLTSPRYIESSSDEMSQFDTARDYHDFDMKNDLFWYDEKDGGNFITPSFEGTEFLGCPTEDKFIMTLDLLHKNQSDVNHNPSSELLSPDYLDKACDFDVGDSNAKNWWNESFEVSEKDSVLKSIETAFELGDLIAKEEEIVNEPEIETNKDGDDEADNEVSLYTACEDEHEVFELRIVHRKNRTGFEASKDFEIVINSVVAGRYYVTEYIGSAAFSKVVQAHDLLTGVDVCLKIIKNDKEFFDQSLDEIKLLKLVNKNDPADERHILRLYDYFYHQEHLFIVCELLRANLYEFQQFDQESGGEAYFTLRRLQIVTHQCLEALEFLHGLGILHCDLKPENILIKSYSRCEIKVINLGSSCFVSDNLCMYVQSRSYRAPEVMLGLPYDQKIDMWSLGCVLAELCSGEVLFPNEGVVTILSRMSGMFGPIDVDMLERGQETSKYFTEELDLYHVNEETDQIEHIIPQETSFEDHLGVNDTGFIDFVRSLLEINPQNRLTAKEALQHPWLSHIYWSNPC